MIVMRRWQCLNLRLDSMSANPPTHTQDDQTIAFLYNATENSKPGTHGMEADLQT